MPAGNIEITSRSSDVRNVLSTPTITGTRPGSAAERAVIALSKRAQATLGQLPYEVFRQAARNGTMLHATNGGAVVGYVLFQVRRHGVIALIHLCVAPEARGLGVARALVDSIVSRYPSRVGIKVRCRNDYEAHDAWPHLGFHPLGSRPGRSALRHPLTDWWRPIEEHSLFAFEPALERRPGAAIDTNIFRDLVHRRDEHPESVGLEADWLEDLVEFVATPQLLVEVRRDQEFATSYGTLLERYRHLAVPPERWEPTAKRLASLVSKPAISQGDLRHLAQATAGGATYLVSRDEALLAHASTVLQETGLQLLSPIDFALDLHQAANEDTYRPAALHDTELSVRRAGSNDIAEIATRFVHSDTGERKFALKARLGRAVGELNMGRGLDIVETSTERLAVVGTSQRGRELEAVVFRVRSGRDEHTFARQLAHRLREDAVASDCLVVRVTDDVSNEASAALQDEGYLLQHNEWIATCEQGLVKEGDQLWARAVGVPASEATPHLVSGLERRYWPAKFVSGGVPTYIVPIKSHWAEALFDDARRQPQLFSRPTTLGLSRHHVYYRSPASLQSPARILWWISGGGRDSGIRAVSWLDEVQTAPPDTLYRRHRRFGIYARKEIRDAAHEVHGVRVATALLFSRTELLQAGIPKERAERLYAPIARNGYLQSTRLVDEHVFEIFYREAGLAV